MDRTSENKDRKMYYSMGEVAELLDVTPTTIRYWEGKFGVLKPHKTKRGNRMFTPEDVENLKVIYHLVKERGMTVEGAARMIRDRRDGLVRDMEVVERLLAIRAVLEEIRAEMGSPTSATVLPASADEDLGDPEAAPEASFEADFGEDTLPEARAFFDDFADELPTEIPMPEIEPEYLNPDLADFPNPFEHPEHSEYSEPFKFSEFSEPEPDPEAQLEAETAAEIQETLAQLNTQNPIPAKPQATEQTLF